MPHLFKAALRAISKPLRSLGSFHACAGVRPGASGTAATRMPGDSLTHELLMLFSIVTPPRAGALTATCRSATDHRTAARMAARCRGDGISFDSFSSSRASPHEWPRAGRFDTSGRWSSAEHPHAYRAWGEAVASAVTSRPFLVDRGLRPGLCNECVARDITASDLSCPGASSTSAVPETTLGVTAAASA